MLNQPLKHKHLREVIRRAIATGEFKTGDRLPSENEMVARYGVSRPTVREAIASLVQEGLVDRQRGRGSFVGRAPATRDIGFVLCGRDYTDPLFSLTLKGVEERCSQLGYRLVYTRWADSAAIAPVESLIMDHGPVLGVIVTGILDLRSLMRLIDLHANTVLVGDVVSTQRTPNVVVRIVSNNYQAAREAVMYLIGRGHHRIAHITGNLQRCWFREPCEAYRACLREHAIPLDDDLLVECEEEGLDYGHQATRRLLALPSPPTAIFATNDRFAWGAIRAVREAGLRIPAQISVVGMNDLPLGDRADFLTTMAANQSQMGAIAVDRIVADASGQAEEIVVPMSLVVRQSSGAAEAPGRKPLKAGPQASWPAPELPHAVLTGGQ